MKKLMLVSQMLVVIVLATNSNIFAGDCTGCCSGHGGVVCVGSYTKCADGTSLTSKCINKGCSECSVTPPVTQCTYQISPDNKSFTSSDSNESVSISASSSSCMWSAISNNNSWITITSNSSGFGSGTISYSVSANTDINPRTGTLTVGGKTFTVTQSGKMPDPVTTLTGVCIHVQDDLTLNMCVQYQNNYYTGTFKYSPVQNLPDGTFYWKLDASTLKPATDSGYCFPVSSTLDMNICGEYHETEYEFGFKYAPTGTDSESLLNWKIDLSSFKQRNDANQDTVYNYAKDITQSYQKGNLNQRMERVSKVYLDNGTDYSCEYEYDNYDVNTYIYSSYSYLINSVSYGNKNGKQIAKINRIASGTMVNKYDSTQKDNFNEIADKTLIFEDGKWKMYGNQKTSLGPSALEIVTCESIDTTTSPHKPVGVKNVFTSSDNGVYIVIKLDGIHNGSVVYTKSYKPDGTLNAEDKHYTFDWGAYPKCISSNETFDGGWKIKGYETWWKQNVGVWRVEVYADNVKVGETTFEYQP